ncbi:MAG TPA: peptidylprolyl isomerase [Acidimicrobiales bacterium]|nr:peptidylprolyl isomerase [Acidimicrobiales bacterium]
MTRPRLALVALVAAVAALAAGCSAFTPYAAKVDGDTITERELRRELNAIKNNKDFLRRIDEGLTSNGGEQVLGAGADTFNSTFVAALLNRRIRFALIHEEVLRRKLQVTDDIRKETQAQLEKSYGGSAFRKFPKSYRDELIEVFSEDTVLRKALPGGQVSDADVAKFYEDNKAVFDRTCVRHILVADEAAAKAIKARLDGGEDFAAIAKAESTDNQVSGGSARKGGDLGCVAKNTLVPEFEAVMDTLQPGQISGPVQSKFGWHIIQVLSRKTVSLEEAAPDIRQYLAGQQTDPVGAYLMRALDKAKITVNPRYGAFQRGESPGVKAPKELEAASTTSVPLPSP